MKRISDKSGHAWAKIRTRIMRRDCGLCQLCLRNGRVTQAKQVDHVRALLNGGNDDDENLQAICHSCHTEKTRADLGRKPSGACTADGIPIAAGHHWNKG